MKINRSMFALSLLFAMGSTLAADPVKTDKPTSSQPMDHSKMQGDAFAKLDTNKDGKLSKAEMAKDPKAAHFSMLDTDKSGSLSPVEFAKASSM